jgi:hypothetical protein
MRQSRSIKSEISRFRLENEGYLCTLTPSSGNLTQMAKNNGNSKLNATEEVLHDNNLQSAGHERIMTKHDVTAAETGDEKSETKKTLFDVDQQKVDISELITVFHPLQDEHKGVLNEKQLNAIQKGDYVRIVGGWHNSWPRTSVLVCPQVFWLQVIEVQEYHLKVEIPKPPRLFGPDFEPQFLLPKTTVTDVRNGKYSVSHELQKGECPLCGRKGRK